MQLNAVICPFPKHIGIFQSSKIEKPTIELNSGPVTGTRSHEKNQNSYNLNTT